MNYAESIAYIDSLSPTILNPSLARFAQFMDEQGRIQDRIRSIHIGGTNGKGSTVAITDSVLRAAGLNVGRFTGPHLLRWNERFHLNGNPITDDVFAQYATKLRELSEDFGVRHPEHGHLTWFEFLTALAFFYFYDQKVDVAVFEVGLGGRWDATNVLSKPLCSCITTIDLDHTHILGGTVSEIAGEKAGIIKAGVPIVTGTTGDALQVISRRAEEVGAELVVCQAPDTVRSKRTIDASAVDEISQNGGLHGKFQQQNLLLAFTVLQICESQLRISAAKAIAKGWSNVYWPGRFQYLSNRHTIMDGAHNAAGAAALREALDQQFPQGKRIFVLSYFQNKNVLVSIESLVRSQDEVFVSAAKGTRAVFPVDQIVALCASKSVRATSVSSIAEAYHLAEQSRVDNELIVVTGSFATIKETVVSLGWTSVEDGRKETGNPQSVHMGTTSANGITSYNSPS